MIGRDAPVGNIRGVLGSKGGGIVFPAGGWGDIDGVAGLDGLQVRSDRIHSGCKILMGKEQFRTCIVDDVGPFCGGQAVIEWDRDGACLASSVIEDRHFKGVFGEIGKAVSDLQPLRYQEVSQPIGLFIGIRIG